MIIDRIINRFKRFFKEKYVTYNSKHISVPVSEMFFQHNGQQDFLRYDMIVRLLAVECYFGKNDYGLDFYKRM